MKIQLKMKAPEGKTIPGQELNYARIEEWHVFELESELQHQRLDHQFPENGADYRLEHIEMLINEFKRRGAEPPPYPQVPTHYAWTQNPLKPYLLGEEEEFARDEDLFDS